MPLTHLDLFSGIGGFALAARMVGDIETRQFVEIDPYCQKVLAKNFPEVPIHDDIRTFTAIPGRFDLITGGFPCQDISQANPNAKGLEGERSGLFYELMRIIRECRPRFVVLENVGYLLRLDRGQAMGAVLWELSESGFNAEWQVVSASSVGALHQRDRVFIVAYTHSSGRKKLNATEITAQSRQHTGGVVETGNPWAVEPGIYRVADGVPCRVDRIRGLGNAVVPQAAAVALNRVLQIESASFGIFNPTQSDHHGSVLPTTRTG